MTPSTPPPALPTPLTQPPPSVWSQLGDYVFFENPLRVWAIAIGVAIMTLVVLGLIRRALTARAARWAAADGNGVKGLVLRLLARTTPLVSVALAVVIGALWLEKIGVRLGRVLEGVVVVALAVQAVVWSSIVLDYAIGLFLAKRTSPDGQPDGALVTTMASVRFLAMVALYAMVILFVLSNFGIDVTAMVAGLGVGGIAVALAVQNILGDLFGSLSIVLDKPFVVGDFIVVGNQLGTVERIGLKTTRLRALSGEQLVFANSDLLASRIQNFKRMRERRVVFGFGVAYQTSRERIREIPAIVRAAIEAQPLARFDRAHFKAFGASSLEFEVVYYVNSPDFNPYMDTQQEINLAIMRGFEERGIRFAYPTQRLVLMRPEQAQGAAI